MPVIVLQPPRLISLASAGTETQAEQMAALVDNYRFVTPYIRVIRAGENVLDSTNGIDFIFLTAAVLLDPNESNASGTRFKEITVAAAIKVKGITAASVNGDTFTFGSNAGKMTSLEHPGALLIWKATNAHSVQSTCMFEIHLVCRA